MQPDLRTKEGALYFLNYHAPDGAKIIQHAAVNQEFQILLGNLYDAIPDGPGKTRFIHALNRARMEAISCIANEGA